MEPVSTQGAVEHYGRFIPATRHAVLKRLTERESDGETRSLIDDLAHALEEHRHQQYRALSRTLRRTYLPFSPDRDTLRLVNFSEAEKARLRGEFLDTVTALLHRANYETLSETDINTIISDHQPRSLLVKVDLDDFDYCALFFRDSYSETISYRDPKRAYLRKVTETVESFRRLFVVLKLKDTETRTKEIARERGISEKRAARILKRQRRFLPKDVSADFIYVRVFKNISKSDVQILFPNRKVVFKPFDKLKLAVTAGGGTVTGVASTFGKLVAATNPIALGTALFGFVTLVGRQVTKFFNHHTAYMAELSQKLFFHALASNRAALSLLLDRAEEEDVKEDLFTLIVLAGRSLEEGDIPAAKAEIEALLLSHFRAGVDFELQESLGRLSADGSVRREGGTCHVPDLATACAHYRNLPRQRGASGLDADAATAQLEDTPEDV